MLQYSVIYKIRSVFFTPRVSSLSRANSSSEPQRQKLDKLHSVTSSTLEREHPNFCVKPGARKMKAGLASD